MPLIQLWEKTPDIVLQYNIKQIVSAAGDGVLADNSECSKELRHYLGNIPAEKLFEHVEYCLSTPFDKGGFALQDIINELGRRLDYEVENGLYQGRSNQIGYDGIWYAPNGHAIIIEIKTTDAYRINLDTIASYRNKLIESNRVTSQSSILIIVGRNDTGDLEAQIRGSRHAWDARIISTEALLKLVELKIKSDEDETTEKIRSLLTPFEYTRLDNIIDVMFTAAKDVETASEEIKELDEDTANKALKDKRTQEHTPREVMDGLRKDCVDALSKRENTPLIANKRVQFWSSDKKIRSVCLTSKQYADGNYWYGLRVQQNKFLADAERGYLLLGCVGHSVAYAIPYETIAKLLPYLTTSGVEGECSHWHLHIFPGNKGKNELIVPKKDQKIDLTPYELHLPSYSLKIATA